MPGYVKDIFITFRRIRKEDKDFIFVALLALITAVCAFIMPLFFTGTLALFLVIFSALKWGLTGGLALAVWSTLTLAVVFLSPEYLSVSGFITASLGFLIIGTLLGCNITRYKETEKRLQESQKLFSKILDATNDGIWDWDLKTGVVNFSDNHFNMLGYEPGEFEASYKNWSKLIHPDDWPAAKEVLKETLKGKQENFEIEFRAKTKDGNHKWLYGKGKVLDVDEFGYPLRIVGGHIDISERKEQEEKLKQSQEQLQEQKNILQSILDNAPIGIWLVDRDQNLITVNNYFKENTGFGTENCSMTEEEFITCKQINDDALSKQKPQQYEQQITFKDGNKHILQTMKTKIFNKDASILGVLGLGIDITDRKQLEDNLRYMSFNDRLTGLYNRAYMEEQIARLDTKRQLPIGIIMVDLNGLKLINDTYGHAMGDELLKIAAKTLKNSCRNEDIISRWGGDEFVILLPQTVEKELKTVCQRIKDSSKGIHVKDIPVSIALGYQIKESTQQKITEVLKEAEDYMYKHKLTESRSNRNSVLDTLLKTLAAKSYETETHSQRMQLVAWKMGEKLGLSEDELNRLILLITLHDIGKINIPEETLIKKTSLDDKEWKMIKEHPETGCRIARATDEFAHVAEDILAHHERWDGKGYPRGLKGKEIPLLARITAIADAYEVMSNGRPYKEPLSRDEIIAEVKRCAGTQFDPCLVKVFIENLEYSINNQIEHDYPFGCK